MKRAFLSLAVLASVTAHAAQNFTATLAPDDTVLGHISESAGTVVSNPTAWVEGYISDMNFIGKLDLNIAAAPGFTITGYIVDMGISGSIQTDDRPRYFSDGPSYVTIGTPYGGGTYTAGGDFSDQFQTTVGGLHQQSLTLGGDFYLSAHGENFCFGPLDVCPIEQRSMSADLWISSFTVTPIFASTVPEPSAPLAMLGGLAVLGLARSWRAV